MASRPNGTLYRRHRRPRRRVREHATHALPGFTAQYGCILLVWYERYELMPDAIAREKQIECGSRGNKLALIEALNPQSRDLTADLA